MPSRTCRSRLPSSRLCGWLAVCCLLAGSAGCVLPWERDALLKDGPEIGSVQGPDERRLRNLFRKQADAADADLTQPLLGTDEYAAANDLYEAGQFEDAESAFRKLSKSRKFKKTEIREDAMFMWGEAAFQQKRLAKAHDAYAELLRDYPSTRHLDVVSQRLFSIGMTWLDHPQIADMSEIKQANLEEPRNKIPAEKPPAKPRTPVFVPNLTDKGRPLFDTEGNGVAALRAIWLHDTTGPLADDALMLAASHHARRGEFFEADHLFTLLREQYPTSPHLQEAFELGSHVKLMAYQGPAYDVKALEDSKQLKEALLRLYGDTTDADRVKEELARIEHQEALKHWDTAQFYMKKNKKSAASVSLHLLLERYPESQLADNARAMLNELGPEYSSGQVLLNPRPNPKAPSIFSAEGVRRMINGGESSAPAPNLRPAPASIPQQDGEPGVDPYDPSVVETPDRSGEGVEPAGADGKPKAPRWSVPRLLPSFGGEKAKPLPLPEENDSAADEAAGKVSF